MNEVPLARQKNLIIEELPDELLVYDLNTDKAHCLNRAAASIWKSCDGEKSVAEIAESLERQLGSPVGEQSVKLGLAELSAHALLEGKPASSRTVKPSRRELIKKLGLSAAVGLPLIISITAPTAAHAQSVVVPPADPCAVQDGKPAGCPCTNDNQCASFNCNEGICQQELVGTGKK